MSERELTPEVRQLAYSRFLKPGICPNTGLACDEVAGLSLELSASRDSMFMAGSTDYPLGAAAAENYVATSIEIHSAFDKTLVDSRACLGGCALRPKSS